MLACKKQSEEDPVGDRELEIGLVFSVVDIITPYFLDVAYA